MPMFFAETTAEDVVKIVGGVLGVGVVAGAVQLLAAWAKTWKVFQSEKRKNNTQHVKLDSDQAEGEMRRDMAAGAFWRKQAHDLVDTHAEEKAAWSKELDELRLLYAEEHKHHVECQLERVQMRERMAHLEKDNERTMKRLESLEQQVKGFDRG